MTNYWSRWRWFIGFIIVVVIFVVVYSVSENDQADTPNEEKSAGVQTSTSVATPTRKPEGLSSDLSVTQNSTKRARWPTPTHIQVQAPDLKESLSSIRTPTAILPTPTYESTVVPVETVLTSTTTPIPATIPPSALPIITTSLPTPSLAPASLECVEHLGTISGKVSLEANFIANCKATDSGNYVRHFTFTVEMSPLSAVDAGRPFSRRVHVVGSP